MREQCGACRADAGVGGNHALFRFGNVGTAQQQIGRQALRNDRRGGFVAVGGMRDARFDQRTRAASQKYTQRQFLCGAALLERRQLRLCRRDFRFELAQGKVVDQSRVGAYALQAEIFAAQIERLARGRNLAVQRHQTVVGLDGFAGERDEYRVARRFGGEQVGVGGLGGIAQASPQIDFVGDVELSAIGVALQRHTGRQRHGGHF